MLLYLHDYANEAKLALLFTELERQCRWPLNGLPSRFLGCIMHERFVRTYAYEHKSHTLGIKYYVIHLSSGRD